jgi:hypothetical protein
MWDDAKEKLGRMCRSRGLYSGYTPQFLDNKNSQDIQSRISVAFED